MNLYFSILITCILRIMSSFAIYFAILCFYNQFIKPIIEFIYYFNQSIQNIKFTSIVYKIVFDIVLKTFLK